MGRPSDQSVTFKTAAIINEYYLVAKDWGEIPVNTSIGEDVNSKMFGGIHFPPKPKGSKTKEDGLTIARGGMEIEADLINQSESEWLVEKVTLNVIKKHSIADLKTNKGTWNISNRASSYNPLFEIAHGTTSVSDIPYEVVIWPKEDMVDSRIVLEVATADEISGTGFVYQFDFTVILSEAGGSGETVEIKSDRSFFIAAE